MVWCGVGDLGMLIGVVGAMASFVMAYASLRHVTVTACRTSNVVRTFEEQAVLASCRGKVVTISLSGFIFFGSAVQLLEEVKRHVIVVDVALEPDEGSSEMAWAEHLDESTPLMRGRAGEHKAYSSLEHSVVHSKSCLAPPSPMPIRLPETPEECSQQRVSSSFTSQCSNRSHGNIALSYSHLAPIYDLSSDGIMRRHEKWQKCGKSSDSAPSRSDRGSFEDSDHSGQTYIDIESRPEPAIGGPADVTYLASGCVDDDDLKVGSKCEVRSPAAVTTSESRLEDPPSLLESIWSSQAYFRRHRKRSSSQSLKRSGPSTSNLQLQCSSIPLSTDNRSTRERGNVEGNEYGNVRTEFMVLNFTDVSGLDATAARSCFLMLVQLLRNAGATVVFACPRLDIRVLLGAHGVILDTDEVMDTLDEALEWCEEQVLFRL